MSKKILDTTTNNKEYKLVQMSDWLHELCEFPVKVRGSCRLCKHCKRLKPRNWKNYRRHQWRNIQPFN